MKAYILLKPNRMIYSCGLKADNRGTYRTCLIGFRFPKVAEGVKAKLQNTIEEPVDIGMVDTEDTNFVTMVRLNNLAILIAETYTDEGDKLGFTGHLDTTDYGIDEDNAAYLDVIYENS